MTTWIIEPHDPLIVRDGRPFGPDPGARAKSLPFPFPSTTAGGVRTRAGLKDGVFDDSADNISLVKNIGVRGPLLVELDEAGQISRWLAPAPADALLLPVGASQSGADAQVERRRLVPLAPVAGANTNLDDGLALVGLTVPARQKPFPDPPRFWTWDQYEAWLTAPQTQQRLLVQALGHQGPLPEQRMHVRLDPDTATGMEGFLFQTSGLEFARPAGPSPAFPATRLALAVETGATIPAGVAPLGGERRLMSWQPADSAWPRQPQALKNEIVRTKACRLLLLTPGYFAAGYLPAWVGRPANGVTPALAAVALARPQVVSGWDFEKDKPKPTRRLAPAGTVYFLKLNGSESDIERWVDKIWMQCVSDEDENRLALAGFGLAVLGVWSGQLEPMEETS